MWRTSYLLFIVGVAAETTINVNFENLFEGFAGSNQCRECPVCPSPSPSPSPTPMLPVPAHLQTMFPNVNLAPNSIFAEPIDLNRTMATRLLNASQTVLLTYAGQMLQLLPTQLNKTKVDALNFMNDFWYNTLVSDQQESELPSGYYKFGSPSLMVYDNNTLNDLRETVAVLFKTNPFYASALSLCDLDRPCLRSRTGDAWFVQILRNFNQNAYPMIDAIFDDEMHLVDWKVYKMVNGTETIVTYTEQQAYELISGMINFYSECIHAATHTIQYVIGSAIIDATANAPSMRTFAEAFALNVYKTYHDLANLDLKPGGVLVGGLFDTSRDGLLTTISRVLGAWGTFTTAQQFLDDFVLGGFKSRPSVPISLGLLTEFRAQIALIGPYTNELMTYFRTHPEYQLDLVESELEEFFAQTGRQPTTGRLTFEAMSSLSAWIQIQAATATFHGSTLSFTRFMATKAAIVAFSPADAFTTWDLGYLRAAMPTTVGAQKGRYVFNSTQLSNSGVTDANILTIFRKYANLSDTQKASDLAKYQAAGKVETEGWLVADFFPDGFDGRQLTFNSYL